MYTTASGTYTYLKIYVTNVTLSNLEQGTGAVMDLRGFNL